MTIRSEGATPYRVRSAEDDDLIRQALAILDSRLRTTDDVFITNPEDTRSYLRLQLAEREAEVFCVLFLTNRHRVIAFEEMFQRHHRRSDRAPPGGGEGGHAS
jgi:DNA repair protein RadC